MPIEAAERFASITRPSGGRESDGLGDDPPVDLADQPVLLGYRQEAAGQDDFVVAPDHPQQQLLAGPAAGEGHDGLGVQDEPVLVDRVADASEPREGVELPLGGGLFLLLLGDVAEDDDDALDVGPLRSGAEE